MYPFSPLHPLHPFRLVLRAQMTSSHIKTAFSDVRRDVIVGRLDLTMSASAVSNQRSPSKPISRYVITTRTSIYSVPLAICMPVRPSLDVRTQGINLLVTSASLDAVVRSLFTSVFSWSSSLLTEV